MDSAQGAQVTPSGRGVVHTIDLRPSNFDGPNRLRSGLSEGFLLANPGIRAYGGPSPKSSNKLIFDTRRFQLTVFFFFFRCRM